MPFRPDRRPPATHRGVVRIAYLTAALALAWPAPASATFHLNQITKVMAGYNGDATIQAVEIQMLGGGENLVNGAAIKVYDGAGNLVSTLGTFAADLPAANALAGNYILCATMKFKQHFGITPDLQISAGLLPTSGQVSFEKPTCLIDAVSYGNVTTFKVGTSAAPPLPTSAAAVLTRFAGLGTLPSCPLADDSGTKFNLTTGSPSNPVTFTNNSGVAVDVSSTVTGVEATIAAPALRIAPNPVRIGARIQSPGGGRLAIYDVQGRLVHAMGSGAGASPYAAEWNATDRRGRPVPSGVYFLRYEGLAGTIVRRFVVSR
ncbi:MAG TPA: T9SS type A sorting domain-containing protein [Candidatus Eisenbacteria bacterium]